MTTTRQQLPATMRSLVAPRYTDPSGYKVIDVPLPTLTGPDDVLVRVHAAAIQTGDTQLAAGQARIFTPSQK
jgi:NADPH:quinone reductase-like Zn-dependent oxidoreductase